MTIRVGVRLTYNVRQACREALLSHVAKAQGIDSADLAIVDIFAAYNRATFGPAPGSTAVHLRSGQTATRYVDQEFKTLRWCVWEDPARSGLTAERMDHLPNDGRGWVVNERPWQDFVSTSP